MHLARKDHGAAWRRQTFRIAPWYEARFPQKGVSPPVNCPDTLKHQVAPPVKRTFVALAQQRDIEHGYTYPLEGYLRFEFEQGGRTAVLDFFSTFFAKQFGPAWRHLPVDQLFEDFICNCPEAELLETAVDLATCHLLVEGLVSHLVHEATTQPCKVQPDPSECPY